MSGHSHSLIIRLAGLCYFLGAGFLPARRFFGFRPVHSILLAPLISTIPLTIIGSGIYFFHSLSPSIIIFLLWIPVLLAVVVSFMTPATTPDEDPLEKHSSVLSLISLGLYCLLMTGFFAFLFIHRTTESLLGPWDHLSALPLILYFLASITLVVFFVRDKHPDLGLCALVVHFFSSFSVALIRFPLGFGFDPILHMAAERIVFAQGTIQPKTLYYIGQYVLVPFFSKLFSLPVKWIHLPLLPLFLALGIGPLCVRALHNFFEVKKERCLLIVLTILAIPYPYLTMTTPWGLAYGTIFFVLLSSALACSEQWPRFMALSLACALFALTLHPLVGIPLCIFVALLTAYRIKNHTLKLFCLGMGAFFATISIPLAFYVNSLISTQFRISLNWAGLSGLFHIQSLLPVFATRFSPFLDFAYFFLHNGWLFFIGLATYGAFLLFNGSGAKKGSLKRHFLLVCLIMAVALPLEALITTGLIHFETLASFEQHDYGERLVSVAYLFLTPFVACAMSVLFDCIFFHARYALRCAAVCFLAAVITSSLYLSYPHNDAYTPFHGSTLSSTDLTAVRFIDNDGGTLPYVVIANQVLASAAIHEFGFKTYYTVRHDGVSESLFYYPIPSGSPLAPIYYSMLTAPSREKMNNAMRIVGVSRAYFVVRDYEPRFPIIVRDAKKTADSWQEIDDGKAYVFLFTRKF